MSTPKEYWNNQYMKYPSVKPVYDLWLDKYKEILIRSKDTPIIDLGCGGGNDSLYLSERGYKVVSCDISEDALEIIKEFIPDAETKVIDMRKGLPFEDTSTKVIIADLSLHYFYWNETVGIVNEIKRVLIPGGYLLCRVNSVNDVNYGAGQGTLLEENYYDAAGKMKRFFDKKQIIRLFDCWNFSHISEYEMDRYGAPKVLWEAAIAKKV